MNILLTNDDGIEAQGLRELCDAMLEAGHRVWVCAPAEQQSAVSHAITLHRALEVTEVSFPGAEKAWAVKGTPADSSRTGVCLVKDIDMVVSGINDGANMGGECIYSGTVGAAMEASMAGVPAIAVSQTLHGAPHYDAAARTAARLAEWAVAHPLPRGAIYNLNVPHIPYSELKGIRPALLAPMYLDDPTYVREDTSDGMRCLFERTDRMRDMNERYDAVLTKAGWATVTILTWNIRMEGPDPDLTEVTL